MATDWSLFTSLIAVVSTTACLWLAFRRTAVVKAEDQLLAATEEHVRNIAEHALQDENVVSIDDELNRLYEANGKEGVAKLEESLKHNVVSEWVLSHALRMNPKIPWSPVTGGPSIDKTDAISKMIARTIRKAFWDRYREQLNGRDSYNLVIERLSELRDRVAGFMPVAHRVAFAAQLDMEIVTQLVRNDRFDFNAFVEVTNILVGMLARVESPAAHEDTIAFVNDKVMKSVDDSDPAKLRIIFNGRIVDTLAFFFGQCDRVEAELAEFRESLISSKERKGRERAAFDNVLKEGVLRLTYIHSYVETNPSDHQSNWDGNRKRELLRGICTQVFSMIFSGDFKHVHEPMRLDIPVLIRFRNSYLCIARLAVIHVCLSAHIRVESAVTEQIWNALIENKSVQEVEDMLLVEESKGYIKPALIEAYKGEGPVAELMQKRIQNGLLVLIDNPTSSIVGISSTFIQDRMREFATHYFKFIADYLDVYADVYKTTYSAVSVPPTPETPYRYNNN